jgi:L-ascorbate metabolism protein UlaG (beta-lactamase superfamily)
MAMRLTHIGGPTVLIELGGWRLLTDPTFDPAGGKYNFGWGTGSVKTTGPAIAAGDIGRIDAVLLSHDHHDDNLDAAGRALLPEAGTVVTTIAGAKRLGGGARGLAAWDQTVLTAPGRTPLEIVATPCRHGPPLSRPIVGDVVGFGVRQVELGALAVAPSKPPVDLWISGDTVLYDGVREVAERLEVDVALIHLGGVRFPISGPLRYTMDGAEAAELVELVDPRVAVPIHYEGWRHFREGREQAEAAFAGGAMHGRLRWAPLGSALEV